MPESAPDKPVHSNAVLLAVGIGTLLSAMAGSAVTLILPEIGKVMGVPLDKASWIMIGFMLAVTVLLLVAGMRADFPGQPPLMEAPLLEPLGDGVRARFDAAYVQSLSPYTSLGSILTGRYPSGIPLCGHTLNKKHRNKQEQPWCSTLPSSQPTLPEVLQLYGYHTAFFHTPMEGVGAFDSEFEYAVEFTSPPGPPGTGWDDLLAEMGDWWSQQRDSPRLVVVAVGDLMLDYRPDLATAMGLASTHWDNKSSPPSWNVDTPGLSPYSNLDLDPIHAEVRAEARRVGQRLAGLLDTTRAAPHRQRLVVLSSLCGMSLLERTGSTYYPPRYAFHDILLERTAHVPLVFLGPSVPDELQTDLPVELVDILPTLLARTHAVIPASLPGRDLLSPSQPDTRFATAYLEFGDMLAIRQGQWLFTLRAMMHNTTSLNPGLTEVLSDREPDTTFPEGRDSPWCELRHPGCLDPAFYTLHDVVADPLQTHNLLWSQPERVRQMRRDLIRIRTGPHGNPELVANDQALFELRLTASEGYW